MCVSNNLILQLQLQSFLTCFLWENVKSSAKQALSFAFHLSGVVFFVCYESVFHHSYHDNYIYCRLTVMVALKYEFKISVTQSHKSSDTLISRVLFRKVLLKHKPVHKILAMVSVLISKVIVLSVLYMHCHYCVDCNKTLKGWTHFKWGRGQHLGPRENHRIPLGFQSRV